MRGDVLPRWAKKAGSRYRIRSMKRGNISRILRKEIFEKRELSTAPPGEEAMIGILVRRLGYALCQLLCFRLRSLV